MKTLHGTLVSLHVQEDAGTGLCNDLPHWAMQFKYCTILVGAFSEILSSHSLEKSEADSGGGITRPEPPLPYFYLYKFFQSPVVALTPILASNQFIYIDLKCLLCVCV